MNADGALARDTPGFGLFQALRLIDSAHPDRPGLGRSLRPGDDAVRLGQRPRLDFTSAELAEYRPASDGRPARLVVNVPGLLGPNGPMPLYFLEYTHNRLVHAGDPTLVGFLDIFQHRQLSLFYRAWAAAQPVVGLDRGPARAEGYAHYVASLSGLSPPTSMPAATPTAMPRACVDELDKLQFCALLATRTRHASGLGLLLSRYLCVPVAIRQFVGLWLRLSRRDRTALRGHAGSTLGEGLVVGKRVWDRQSKFRIVIGPVGKSEMHRLLPGAASHRRLVEWVDLYTGGLLLWDIELRLKPEAAIGMRFDGRARLAYTSWLGWKKNAGKPAMLHIQPHRNIHDTR